MSCDQHCDPCAGCGSGHDCACAAACGTPATLAPPANRAGRDTLRARLGNHGDFLADALRRLSANDAPALRALGTRDLSDPAIALLDAWAVAADVLTFYRERLTNEAYLRTARSERSLRELAAGVGFKPRPGVAATVHLAFLLDASAAPVQIPAGAKTQTIPQPGEQMQTFETDEALLARAEWSTMTPRLTRVPAVDRVAALTRLEFRLNDASLVVRPGERLLFRFGDRKGAQVGREVASARNDVVNGWLVLTLKPRPGLTREIAAKVLALTDDLAEKVEYYGNQADPKMVELLEALVSYLLGASAIDALTSISDPSIPVAAADDPAAEILALLLTPTHSKPIHIESADIDASLAALGTAPEAQLRSSRYLDRKASAGLGTNGAMRGALLQSLAPALGTHLYAAWNQLPGTTATPDVAPDLYLLRSVHSPYGANAPLLALLVRDSEDDWTTVEIDRRYAFLDGVNEAVHPDSYALIQTPRVNNASSHTVRYARVIGASSANRGDYSQNSKVTRLELVDPNTGKMLDVLHDVNQKLGDLAASLGYLRNTVYAVQSELVTLAAEPIAADVGGDSVVLNGLYDGLDVGRWIVVAGERTDIKANGAALPGIRDGELAMIAAIEQAADPASPADSRHTVVFLRNKLAFTYRRDSVSVYGNVAPASHGETVSEVMGSGDARARLATYTLKRAPLTYVAAPTASGALGTQVIRVNDVRWHEVDSLLDAGPGQRVYELSTDASGAATVVFGDGSAHGARLPTGQDNLRAQFRVGIGRGGNVQPGQITLLSTRPLGVQGVINPLRAAGGADRDGIEQIRRNLPQAVLALSPRSRLVSVRDYAYFAQRFAAIGHAQAVKVSDGGASVIYVTLAGVGDIPLDPEGTLLDSLYQAFRTYGDPAQRVQLGVRELIAVVLQAKVAIDADADWNVVEPSLRARLLDRFSFDRAQLGQPVYLSAVVAAMQATPGVAWVDVDVFGGISELELRDKNALTLAVAKLEMQAGGGDVPDRVERAPDTPAADASQSPPEQIAQRDGEPPRFLPAQLVMLVPDVPGTLVFNLVETEGKSC